MYNLKYIVKNIKEFNKEDLNDFYLRIPKQKRMQIDKYKNYEAKTRTLVAEILLNNLLASQNISYQNTKYFNNKYGKPYLKNSELFFNVSHSFDYVITTISNKEIGIDIEKVRKTSLKVINQFATSKEKKYILSSDENIEERIFKIYTLKEAYFKMLGTNLNHILEIEFIIKNDKVYCSDKNVKVGFINDVKGYIIAYCEKK